MYTEPIPFQIDITSLLIPVIAKLNSATSRYIHSSIQSPIVVMPIGPPFDQNIRLMSRRTESTNLSVTICVGGHSQAASVAVSSHSVPSLQPRCPPADSARPGPLPGRDSRQRHFMDVLCHCVKSHLPNASDLSFIDSASHHFSGRLSVGRRLTQFVRLFSGVY